MVFQIFTIALFTFYLVADGPRLRRTICSVLPPERQEVVLQAWELAIEKTGSYLYSRFILAVLSTAFHWIVLAILGVPYALALALWVGIVSQFIPVVGTYLAGALAVLVALLNDPVDGVIVLIFVIVYQQVENYIFVPRVTAQTLELHPAVAFGTVIAGAAILGPVGALLALPAAAVIRRSSRRSASATRSSSPSSRPSSNGRRRTALVPASRIVRPRTTPTPER